MELANIIVAAVAAVLSLVSIIFSVYTYSKALIHDRRQATLDAYQVLQDSALDKLNHIGLNEVDEILGHPRSAEYKDRYKDLSGYVARIEHFCVGVNTGIYDKQTVYELAHGYLDMNTRYNRIEKILDTKEKLAKKEYYKNTRDVIKWMREKSNK